MDKTLLTIYISEGLSTREIAEKIGKSQNSVMYWLKKHDLKTLQKHRGGRKATKVESECLYCHKPIRNYATFCDNTCYAEHTKEQKIQDWLDGNNDGSLYDGQIAGWLRDYLIESVGYKCPECGWGKINPTTGRVPLQIDHIDGDWKNQAKENLRVLCPNCHSLTPTFGILNKGNGRRQAGIM